MDNQNYITQFTSYLSSLDNIYLCNINNKIKEVTNAQVALNLPYPHYNRYNHKDEYLNYLTKQYKQHSLLNKNQLVSTIKSYIVKANYSVDVYLKTLNSYNPEPQYKQYREQQLNKYILTQELLILSIKHFLYLLSENINDIINNSNITLFKDSKIYQNIMITDTMLSNYNKIVSYYTTNKFTGIKGLSLKIKIEKLLKEYNDYNNYIYATELEYYTNNDNILSLITTTNFNKDYISITKLRIMLAYIIKLYKDTNNIILSNAQKAKNYRLKESNKLAEAKLEIKNKLANILLYNPKVPNKQLSEKLGISISTIVRLKKTINS